MSDYKIKEEDVHIVKVSKISDSKKDLFDYHLRRTEKGWIVYYDHFNVDDGLQKTNTYFLPDEIVDILTTYHAKDKLNK